MDKAIFWAGWLIIHWIGDIVLIAIQSEIMALNLLHMVQAVNPYIVHFTFHPCAPVQLGPVLGTSMHQLAEDFSWVFYWVLLSALLILVSS
jgi:hypothetical protein